MASLLHDVIEDCEVTKENIEKIFGIRVAEMVDDVTEQDRSLPWVERKRLARKPSTYPNEEDRRNIFQY